MGMWWETAVVGGVMCAVIEVFWGVSLLRNYAHSGKPCLRSGYSDELLRHIERDRDNSKPSFLSWRKRRQGVDDGNPFWSLNGLEKIPDMQK